LNYIYLCFAVAFNVGAYAVFKAIAAREHDLVWASLFGAGLALGGINTLLFTLALREIRLAVAYPMFAGASITFVVLLSALVFGERVSVANVAGAALVFTGIALLTR
jgi:small multidrug resistance pump